MEIAFGDGCGCDRTCGITKECDRFWGWMQVRSYLWDYQSAIVFGDGCGCDRACGITRVRSFLVMDVGAIVLVELENAIVFVMDVSAIALLGLPECDRFW